MTYLYNKTIMLLNLRFADFYSLDLFKNIKEFNDTRIIIVIDQQFANKIPPFLTSYIDKKYILQGEVKDGFLCQFNYLQLANIVRQELSRTKDLRIVCADEFNLLNAGRLRKEFNLGGHYDDELIRYRNKTHMKEILQNANVRVPRFRLLRNSDTFQKLTDYLGSPFVLKPIDSSGSHGVYIIKNKHDFKKFKRLSTHSQLEAEEFIEGKLYHVDILIKDKKIKFIAANEYTCPNHEFINGKTLGSIFLNQDNIYRIALINFAKNVITVLKSNNLICHMELFINKNNDVIFLEVSSRPPGGLIIESHKINYAVNLIDEDLLLQTAMPLEINYSSSRYKAFWAMFPLLVGKITRLNSPEVICRSELVWQVKVGDIIKVNDCKSIMNKSAHGIFLHEDEAVLRQDFAAIKHYRAIEVAA